MVSPVNDAKFFIPRDTEVVVCRYLLARLFWLYIRWDRVYARVFAYYWCAASFCSINQQHVKFRHTKVIESKYTIG